MSENNSNSPGTVPRVRRDQYAELREPGLGRGAAALQRLAEDAAPRLRLHWVFETAPAEGHGHAFAVGQLEAPTLVGVLVGTDLRRFHRAMVCGPDGMRAAVRQVLLLGGLPSDLLVEESCVSPRRGAVSDQDQHAVFDSADGNQAVTVHPGDTLLEAALNGGIALTLSSCSFSRCSGGCGACRVRITDQLQHVVLDEPNAVRLGERARRDTGLSGAPQEFLPLPSA